MEKIDIKEIPNYENLLNEIHLDKEYNVINKKTIDVDFDKSLETFELVIQRLADGKYFKGKYSNCHYDDFLIHGLFTECEKRTRVVTEVYYE